MGYFLDGSTIEDVDVKQTVQTVSECALLVNGADSELAKHRLTGELIEVQFTVRKLLKLQTCEALIFRD
jgi:hypothetical protein